MEWRPRRQSRAATIPIMPARTSTGTIYWEGAVRMLQDGREVGRGYLELTGYGKALKL